MHVKGFKTTQHSYTECPRSFVPLFTVYTVYPESLDPFYKVTYYVKRVKSLLDVAANPNHTVIQYRIVRQNFAHAF